MSNDKPDFNLENFSDRLAEIEFEQWKHWAGQILGKEDISEERAERWRELMATPWEKLPDEIKQKDYMWASKVLMAFEEDIVGTLVLIAEYLLFQHRAIFIDLDANERQFVDEMDRLLELIKAKTS